MGRLGTVPSVAGLLVFGTACSLLAKIVYYVQAPGLHDGHAVRKFEKPWFQVLTMFVGMSLCIVLDRKSKKEEAKGSSAEAQPLMAAGDAVPVNKHANTSVWIINIPTLFDLFATGCGTTGLLFTTVSVYQMLRAGQLVFTALLSVIFLKRRLDIFNVGGILLACCGIALVGFANVISQTNDEDKANQLFGVCIILCGQVLQASQIVIEEFLLQQVQMSGVRVVAYEGLFGVMHCVLWVLPIMYLLPGRDAGRLEDTPDSLYMLSHTWRVAFVMALDMLMMLGYNVCGMGVTANLTGVARVIIETLRTLFVWLIDMLCWYVITPGYFGEPWTQYSWMQAVGFVFLVLGTLVYNYKQLVVEQEIVKEHVVMEHDMEKDTRASAGTQLEAKGIALVRPIEEDDDEELVGSYYAHPVGSAAHASYLGSLREAGHLHHRAVGN
ncbi:Solute carrier family 35 member F6 [Porphyridium purpureum]|uniref:Solute carrier family 35 member F6 n=1 Tax=Porphyridium purpureum TaxID=35688 RepID=A0A5J4Z594_PORPP|nr:Solute carrier family 35 member F6 [Porphyridium purpureum]|eukprot:POR3393..scf295_1